MENQIPSAYEFLKNKYEQDLNSFQDVVEHLKEFAKLHCTKQAKVINDECDNEIEKDFIDSELILNVYPLDNIK